MISRRQSGQASIELIAVLPLVAMLAMGLWQVAIAGQAAWLSGVAARAAARAEAVGADPLAAARRRLPGRLRAGVKVRRRTDGAVEVTVGVPSVIGHSRLGTFSERARFASQSP